MSVRLDKFLWAVRIYKTRSMATLACNGNKVKIAGQAVKPSKTVDVGNIIEVRKGAINYKYKVIDLVQSRVGAKLVQNYIENLTPQSELDKLKSPIETIFMVRDRGTGRPTKKERRALEENWSMLNESLFDEDDDELYDDEDLYDEE